jgi:ATP-dependent helicase/nuclease subunit B
MSEGSIAAGLWTIPAGLPFLDTLVAGLFDRYGREPLALARLTIILPSRRACRALAEAFLRASGGEAMLLPRLIPLGGLDADEIDLAGGKALGESLDLPPPVSSLTRQLVLARLILAWGRTMPRDPILPAQAASLAGDLARFIDEVATAGLDFAGLRSLVPAELATHWQETLTFLDIAGQAWPAWLAADQSLDPADRLGRLITAQSSLWATKDPGPVIAAGFGSASPAAAGLLRVIASLSAGAVILPGIDTGADPTLWAAIAEDPSHPQWGIACLLAALGVTPDAIPEWPAPGSARGTAGRIDLAREVLRPAAVTEAWQSLSRLPDGATDGLARLDLADSREEAGVIALLLRERLETAGATAMLVTPDRGLARRVAAELGRWGIAIDDSAGMPLNLTPPGVFLRLIGEAAREDLAPVPLLALLKHPLAAGGLAPGAFRAEVRTLEREILRGPRPGPGLAGLRAATGTRSMPVLDRLEICLAPLLTLLAEPEIGLDDGLTTLIGAAEALASTADETGAARLWAGEGGEALAGFVSELADAAADLGPVPGESLPPLIEALMAGRVVRPRRPAHPRLRILGTLEARLQQADLVILAGLNEGTWPAGAEPDPWLSRPMRKAFGLPPPEAAIGLAAHDFLMGLGAPEVILTRAKRVDGTPTVPSRWLLRLDAVLEAAGYDRLPVSRRGIEAFPDLQARLDRPDAIEPMARPAPRPPVAARPRTLSVTAIETWMRDPYAIYAEHILKLKALDPLDADPGAAERGQWIHAALALYVQETAAAAPADPLATLLAVGRRVFAEALDRPGVAAFWWPQFERIGRWFIAEEAVRRYRIAATWTERKGEVILPGPGGSFTLRARADRIDRLVTGGLAILDYKTGLLPTKAEIEHGFAPQLPLEAMIAEEGGFDGVAAGPVAELAFWRLAGGAVPGEIRTLETEGIAALAKERLLALIAAFHDPGTPYIARPRPDRAPRFSDYAHLARVAEWSGEESS